MRLRETKVWPLFASRFIPSIILLIAGHECVYDLEKLRSKYAHLTFPLICRSISSASSKSPPKGKRGSTSAAPQEPSPPSTTPLPGWSQRGLDSTREINSNPFSDATAFTDIWSDLFEFQNGTIEPGLTMDMSYDPILPQQFFAPTPAVPLDPEIPSIDTQRTLYLGNVRS